MPVAVVSSDVLTLGAGRIGQSRGRALACSIDGLRAEMHAGSQLFKGLIYLCLAMLLILGLREVFFPVPAGPGSSGRPRTRGTD